MDGVRGVVNAPDFPAGAEWLNTSHPLSLRELRGKVVLLDFWTYCCINCMHVIPDLKRLEEKYPNELVVIGVHSAKFTTERETQNIREAILRYELHHPVVNDKDMRMWDSYAVHGWPTLVLIDPDGKEAGRYSGEGIYDVFDPAIGKVIAAFEQKGKINHTPVRFDLERDRMPSSLLEFPGKVLADSAGKRLFIADSNHNRIVVAALADGMVLDVIGEGSIGQADGPYDKARFHHPQGMALAGDSLYVADTENHLIRAVDLKAKTVATIAGTGRQAETYLESGVGRQIELNSPWDLVVVGQSMYIAMAGPHQLWRMDLKTSRLERFAGSGREGRYDGPRLIASLAQPSGIATDGKKLYFADSEVSSVRSAGLGAEGMVDTIVGLDLFEFGDRDGAGDVVRLQHPLGVAYHEGSLYIADTYNNKIKLIDPRKRSSATFAGTGETALRDGRNAAFNEPGGVSVAGGKLYVADTNNHVIRVIDLKSRQVSTFELKGIGLLATKAETKRRRVQPIELAAEQVAPGNSILTIDVELPEGHKFTANAPAKIELSAGPGMLMRFENDSPSIGVDRPSFPLRIPVTLRPGESEVTADFTIYYCREGAEGRCFFKSAVLKLPVVVKAGANASNLTIAYKVSSYSGFHLRE